MSSRSPKSTHSNIERSKRLRGTIFAAASFAVIILAATLLPWRQPVDQGQNLFDTSNIQAKAESLPLYFIENQGQLDQPIDYYTEGSDFHIYLNKQGIVFVQGRAVSDEPFDIEDPGNPQELWATRLEFVGANSDVKLQSLESNEAVFSYFRGREEDWKTNVRSHSTLIYQGLWEGVDLEISGDAGQLKYTFAVAPGVDPSIIKMKYHDADVTLGESGRLDIATPVGGFYDEAPIAYQGDLKSVHQDVAVKFDLTSNNDTHDVAFTVGDYDPTKVLNIDPTVIAHASLIGGSAYDAAMDIEYDATGIYAGGYTSSSIDSFPGVSGIDTTYNGGGSDGFMFKLDPTGTSVIWATYIGGSGTAPLGSEGMNSITIDPAGNVYATSNTRSRSPYNTTPGDFPITSNALDKTFADQWTDNWDGYITVVDASGTSLKYSSYFGGSCGELPWDIEVDDLGRIYISGETSCWTSGHPFLPVADDYFPATVGPDLTYNISGPPAPSIPYPNDGMVGRLSFDANFTNPTWDYLGYIGGFGKDLAYEIEIDSSYNAYVVGRTASDEATFPDGDGFDAVPGFDQTHGGAGGPYDGFVAKVSADGTGLEYATYIGGSGDDILRDVAIDNSGQAYFTGYTRSDEATFPVLSGPNTTYGGGWSDAILGALNSAGTGLVFNGFFGGSDWDWGTAIELDTLGNVYIAGVTGSDRTADFPVKDGPDLTLNGDPLTTEDMFVSKLKLSDFSVEYAGYIGGSGSEWLYDIELTPKGDLYFSAQVGSTEVDYPNGYGFYSIPGFDQTNAGDQDAGIGLITNVPAGITIVESGGSTDINEDGPTSDTYTVVIDSRPTFDVTVNITPNVQQTTDKSSLLFTPLDWDVPQTVTTTAVDDDVFEGLHTGLINHVAASEDLNYEGLAGPDVVPNIIDDDLVQIIEDGSTEQSIKVSRARFDDDEAKGAIVSRNDLRADPFIATPLATRIDGPMLLNTVDSLHADVATELDRALSSKSDIVYIIGRENAQANQVYDDLTALGYTNVVRLGGENRDETAKFVAEEIIKLNPGATTKSFLAENSKLADPLVTSAEAANKTGDDNVNPILFQDRGETTLDPFTDSFLQANSGIVDLEIIGREAAIVSSMENTLKTKFSRLTVTRTGGSDRWETARLFADKYFAVTDDVVIAAGESSAIPGALSAASSQNSDPLFAALLAGGVAADNNSPLLITQTNQLPDTIAEYLTNHSASIKKVTIIGSGSQVSQAVVDAILAIVN